MASNPAPTARTGAITVGSERVQISQAAAPCRYELSRSGDSIGASGGALSVTVSTLNGCGWTAAADAGWIDVAASSRSGSATGSIQMQIQPNSGGARAGHVAVGGQTYTVEQGAASAAGSGPAPSPSPSPSPAPAPVPSSGQAITLEGTAFAVSGRCPDLSFYVDFRLVLTSRDTDFKKGHCGDLSSGDNVKVAGTTRADGAVDAKQVELRK